MGLATLGVFKEIRKDPCQFENMFIHYINSIQAATVLDKVKFSSKDKTIQGLVGGFINDVSHQGINKSLLLVGGNYSHKNVLVICTPLILFHRSGKFLKVCNWRYHSTRCINNSWSRWHDSYMFINMPLQADFAR